MATYVKIISANVPSEAVIKTNLAVVVKVQNISSSTVNTVVMYAVSIMGLMASEVEADQGWVTIPAGGLQDFTFTFQVPAEPWSTDTKPYPYGSLQGLEIKTFANGTVDDIEDYVIHSVTAITTTISDIMNLMMTLMIVVMMMKMMSSMVAHK